MFKATDLTRRLIINVGDGRRIGPVKDMVLDDSGRVQSIVIQGQKRTPLIPLREKDLVVPWSQVRKIGVDAILVELDP